VPPSEDALEILRSRSGLSLDEEGRFLHRGEPITHARTLEVLHRSLERTPGGRYLVRIGRESAYVEVTDAPYAVRGVRPDAGDGAPLLLLSDGTTEPLDPATLRLGADGVLRCAVKGAHPARFSRAAQVSLGLSLEEEPQGSGCYYLTASGRRWRVGGGER